MHPILHAARTYHHLRAKTRVNSSICGFGCSRWRGLGWTRGRAVAFDVVGGPSGVALEAAFAVGGSGEAVEFAGGDDEVVGSATALKCLAHVLAADDGNLSHCDD